MRKRKMGSWCRSCQSKDKSVVECMVCSANATRECVVKRPASWGPTGGENPMGAKASDKGIRSLAPVIGGTVCALEEIVTRVTDVKPGHLDLPEELGGPTLEELKGIARGKEV